MVTTLSIVLGIYLLAECISALNSTEKLKLSQWHMAVCDIYTLKYFGSALVGLALILFSRDVDVMSLILSTIICLWTLPRSIYRARVWHVKLHIWAMHKRTEYVDKLKVQQ